MTGCGIAFDAATRGLLLDRRVPDSATEAGLHVARIEHLLNRHGTRATEVLDLLADRPDCRHGQR